MSVFNSVLNKALLTVFSASVLLGCSALEDDSDDGGGDSIVTTSMSGKVADGYLAGAKVCLDLNSNKVCDEGEPSTTSTGGGEFSLDGATQAQFDSFPLLVEIVVGETIDEDNPGIAITKKYTLTAPAGYAFISPLTTMVQSEIEESGLSPEEAESSVQAKLGTILDLEADYVAGSEGDTDAAEFERLHKIARVTVVVLQNNIELIDDVLSGSEVSFEDLLGLIVSQVLDALETISTQVDDTVGTFDPNAIAESDALDDANVDPATIEDDLAEREATRLVTTANIAAVLSTGDSLHFFEADDFYDDDVEQNVLEFLYSSVSADDNGAVVISDFMYDTTSSNWVVDTESDTDQNCVLANSTWNCVDEESETITVEGDAVIVKVGNLDATSTEITGVSVDLSGKRIQTFLDDEEFLRVTDPQANFSTGATGYKLSFKRTQDMYALYKDNVATVADCWGGKALAGQSFNPTDEWCNNTFVRTGDGEHSTDGAAATTLAELISATAAINPTDITDIKGTQIYGGYSQIIVEFVTGGVANFYTVKYVEGQESNIESKIVGSWKEEVVDSKTLLSFMLPPLLAHQGDFDRDERSPFFTVEKGYVRHGQMESIGESGDQDWVFNDAARDQIKAAFDFDLSTDFTPCSTGDRDYDLDNLAEDPGATAAEFVASASNCSAVDFTANELVDTTLVAEFGFLDFKTVSEGVFLGEVGDDMNAVLDFTWTVNSNGHIVVSTSAVEEGETVHLRLTLAKIEENARQISLKTFGQEAATAAGLDTAKGNIEGEVWGLN
jgi:hypothetical protein